MIGPQFASRRGTNDATHDLISRIGELPFVVKHVVAADWSRRRVCDKDVQHEGEEHGSSLRFGRY